MRGAVVEPPLARGALRQASIPWDVGHGFDPAQQLRSDRRKDRPPSQLRTTAISSERSNQYFVEKPARVGHLAGLRTCHLV